MAKTDTGQVLREVRNLIGNGDPDSLPDGHLLARFVEQRDESAFEVLVRRYGRLVFGVCRRVLNDPHSAEDAFQATFLVLVHKAPSLDRGRPVADWLYTVAFRLASRVRANAAKRKQKESLAARTHSDTSTPTSPDDVHAILHEELSRLPEQHRVPLVLSYLEGRSYEHVARALGCPLGSVGLRLNRAKEALRDRLTSRGVTCPATGIGVLIVTANAGAVVPASLADATVRAGLWFAGERVGSAVASAHVIELARGAMGTMTVSKWALAAGVLLTVGLYGGMLAFSGSPAAPPAPDKPVAAQKESKPAELPAGVAARMGSAQFRHGETIFFIAYTPDGKQIVTAGRDQAIRLWDRATGQEVRRFERAASKKEPLDPRAAAPDAMPGKMMTRSVGADDFPLTLSPDGKTLAGGKDRTVTVWDLNSGKKLHELTAAALVSELVFTPDGKSLISADTNQTVTLWDPTTAKAQRTFEVKPEADGAGIVKVGAAVSPTGTHLVQQILDTQNANGSLKITELATGKVLPEIKLSAGGAQNLTFSPDGKLLAWSTFTDGVTIWDLAAQKQLAQFGRGEGMKLRFFGDSMCISPDNKSVAVMMGNDTIELWDIATATRTRTIDGYEPDRDANKMAMDTGGRVAVRLVLSNKNRLVKSDLAFSPDGKTIAASLGNATVRQYDAGSGMEVGATPGHVSGVMALGSDGRTTVTVSKESVWVWNATAGQVRHWPLYPAAVAAVVSPDAKRVVTSSTGGVIRIWDTTTGEKIRDIDTKRGDVAGIGFSPDGKIIATKAELNSALNLWDAATGAHIRTIGQDGDPVFSGGRVMLDISGMQTPAIVFSPDGRLIAATADKKQVGIWDAASGTLVSEIPAPSRAFGAAIGFSSNGHVVALLTSDGTVTGYEVATGEKRYEMKPTTPPANIGIHPSDVMGGAAAISALARGSANAGTIAFTPDGRFILTAASRSTIHVWDTLTGQEATQLKGHNGSVSQLRIAPDGRSLVSGSVDTTALLWDLTQLARVDLTRDTPLTAADLDALWLDLAKADPAAAFAATRKLLTARKQAVGLLAERIKAVPAVEDAKIAQLVADLGGNFDTRRKATAELERLGELAVPQLKKALGGNPALDLKQRVEALLQKAAARKLQGDPLREVRAVEVLELAATPEAKQALEALAKGAAGARLTREATAALSRLSK